MSLEGSVCVWGGGALTVRGGGGEAGGERAVTYQMKGARKENHRVIGYVSPSHLSSWPYLKRKKKTKHRLDLRSISDGQLCQLLRHMQV